MNHIRSPRRARLGPDNLEAIMRKRMNGPDLPDFDALRYISNSHYLRGCAKLTLLAY